MMPSLSAEGPMIAKKMTSATPPTPSHSFSSRWTCTLPPARHERVQQQPAEDDEGSQAREKARGARQRMVVAVLVHLDAMIPAVRRTACEDSAKLTDDAARGFAQASPLDGDARELREDLDRAHRLLARHEVVARLVGRKHAHEHAVRIEEREEQQVVL